MERREQRGKHRKRDGYLSLDAFSTHTTEQDARLEMASKVKDHKTRGRWPPLSTFSRISTREIARPLRNRHLSVLDNSRQIREDAKHYGFTTAHGAGTASHNRHHSEGGISQTTEEEPDQPSSSSDDGPPLDSPPVNASSTTVLATNSHDTQVDHQNFPTSSGLCFPRLDSTGSTKTCPTHPHHNIQSCPRECSWNLEQANELAASMEGIELAQLESSGLIAANEGPASASPAHSSRVFRVHRPLSIKPCYILIALVGVTITGSLTGALWRTEAFDDASGGFASGQYFLGAGALVVGCATAVHVKYCHCWEGGVRP